MLLLKQLLSSKLILDHSSNVQLRKRHLIHALSIELLIVHCALLMLSLFFSYGTSTGLFLSTLCTAFNLFLLKKSSHLVFCGHFINLIGITLIIIGNFWLGGVATSMLDWFYISPIIAAVTLGLYGLLLYAALSGIALATFLYGHFEPTHILPPFAIDLITHANPIVMFVLITTVLYHLLIENKHFESLLSEQNFILNAEKQKFHYLSHHDSLTNLPNRSYFNTYLNQLLEHSEQEHRQLTLYYMDLDGFKKINDLYGHEIGDLVLLQASKRLQACFRESDFVARLAGDEFVALIHNFSQDSHIHSISKRIKKEFDKPFVINGLKLACTISVGTANYPVEAHNVEELMKIADSTMYVNKRKKYKASLT